MYTYLPNEAFRFGIVLLFVVVRVLFLGVDWLDQPLYRGGTVI